MGHFSAVVAAVNTTAMDAAQQITVADTFRLDGVQVIGARSTIGTLLSEFTFGHPRQLESVLGDHLAALRAR